MTWRRTTKLGLAGAAIGVAGATALKLVGRRVRHRHDPDLDPALAPPDDVEHLEVNARDGGRIHVAGTGSGRPVLLLHGVTLQWWVWSATIRLLRHRYRVLAWDMRGHGRSTAGSEGVTIDAAADDLAEVIEQLDLRDVVIVGHSMGGMVAGVFARRHHELLHARAAGMMFLATSAAPMSYPGVIGGLTVLSGAFARAARQTLGRGVGYDWNDTDVAMAMTRVAFGRKATDRMVSDVRQMLHDCPKKTLAEAAVSIIEHDAREDLRAVDLPTFVVVGEQDRLTPPVHARGLVGLVGGAELIELPGVGHQVMQEAPEELAASIDKLAGLRP